MKHLRKKVGVMDRRMFVTGMAGLGATTLLGGCSAAQEPENRQSVESDTPSAATSTDNLQRVNATAEQQELEEGLSCILFEGDGRLDAFLEQGGAATDAEVVSFLAGELTGPLRGAISLLGGSFGCSTIHARTPKGPTVFGRNFDWHTCNACVVHARPEGAYASVSTVNTDFLSQHSSLFNQLPADALALALLYAPLDGVNERGLSTAVLMIQDGAATINQSSGKTGLTTTTAIRMLLDRAATVDEALELLEGCDMHASMGLMVHFALADADGRSVAVEYVNEIMTVTQTPILTNFYVSEGEKQGIGTAQSHERFEILSERLEAAKVLSADDVRDALESVCKRNYNDGETTEWSTVYDQASDQIRYYHREDYSRGYLFEVAR